MKLDLRHHLTAVLWWLAALFLLVSLMTFTAHDIPWESAPINRPPRNVGGLVGSYLAYGLLRGVGWSAYLLVGLAGLWGWMCWVGMAVRGALLRIVGTAVLLVACSALWSLGAFDAGQHIARGGFLGAMTAEFLHKYLGSVGAYLVAIAIVLLSMSAVSDFLVWVWGRAGVKGLWAVGAMQWTQYQARRARRAVEQPTPRRATLAPRPPVRAAPSPMRAEKPPVAPPTPKVVPMITVTAAQPQPMRAPTRPRPRPAMTGAYSLPPVDVLQQPPPISERKVQENLQGNSRLLEETLRDFGVDADVMEVEKGPSITRYELQTAPGTKVSRVAALSEELALALRAHSVRVASIPGKSRIGVEVPNTSANTVYLRELVESAAFQEHESKLLLALGKDVSGADLVYDLRDCPHILIAGATGSGKTVCLNAIVTAMLFRATPDDVKFLLIDPKRVELVAFNKIPHLVAPVVTDSKKAATALHWAVGEMENRYKRFADVGVRNLDGYNEKVRAQRPAPREEEEPAQSLPYIVVVIDELADLMAVAANDVEGAIMRLAQMSRAVGIHIVMATQRPSVDVVTGVIKANFPARLAFQVATKVDSRTVLDMHGADKLLGRGDMLFLSPGSPKPCRAQGCFLSDEEIERVVAHIKAQGAPQYEEDFMSAHEQSAGIMRGGERDEFFAQAKDVIVQTGQASTSMLQRRLRLGYTRAARILDQLEEAGVVGPPRGAKPREILIEPPVGVESGEANENSF